MSLETAMAALDKFNTANPLNPIPGANPDAAVLAKPDTNFEIDLKDSSGKRIGDDKKPDEKKAETKTEDKAPEEKEPPKEPREQESKRFAILAKKEKGIQAKVQEIKLKEESINQKLTAVENFEKFKREVKNNPMLALEELGITYNQITDYVLQGKMPNKAELEYNELREEIKALRSERDERDKRAADEAKKAATVNVQQTISDFKSEIGDYIKSNVDRFELVNQYGATNLVYSTVDEHFQKEKRLLSIEEAAELTEKFLEKQVEIAMSTKKYQARVQPQSPKEAPKQNQSVPQQNAQLSNQMTSSAPSFLPAKTEQDRISRALAALK